jgi:hypothetical protein
MLTNISIIFFYLSRTINCSCYKSNSKIEFVITVILTLLVTSIMLNVNYPITFQINCVKLNHVSIKLTNLIISLNLLLIQYFN